MKIDTDYLIKVSENRINKLNFRLDHKLIWNNLKMRKAIFRMLNKEKAFLDYLKIKRIEKIK